MVYLGGGATIFHEFDFCFKCVLDLTAIQRHSPSHRYQKQILKHEGWGTGVKKKGDKWRKQSQEERKDGKDRWRQRNETSVPTSTFRLSFLLPLQPSLPHFSAVCYSLLPLQPSHPHTSAAFTSSTSARKTSAVGTGQNQRGESEEEIE